MKICVLPILARMDPKIQKRRAAAKKSCGWEKPAIWEKAFETGFKKKLSAKNVVELVTSPIKSTT